MSIKSLPMAWRWSLPLLCMTLAAILAAYRETALGMVDIWSRSDTFAHGFLVPPIALWLIWRKRTQLAALTPRPAPWLLLPLLAIGFAWLLGELAAVNVVSQFALVGLLVLAVAAVLGLPLARAMAFPLGFLFFAVPFGEFAMPQLMEWTAQFTVLGLRLTGIPVYREGLSFVIPSGNWSVVEACSGVRYLIASLTVGTLFAYLNYVTLKRRLIFVAVSFLVPIAANWVRAYIIVMLGHLSGNKLAAGVDHLIYGWFFFGLVIMAMFWIGARWREDEMDPAPPAGVSLAAPARGRVALAALLAVLCAASWPLLAWRMDHGSAAASVQLAAPAPPGWTAEAAPLTEWQPYLANPDATLRQAYARDGQRVGVHVAWYRNQDRGRKLVSSLNTLVRSDDKTWERVGGGTQMLTLNGRPVTVRTAELAGPAGVRLLVWHWYWINGETVAGDLRAKLLTARARLLGQGDDSAQVVVYAEQGAGSGAGAAAARLEAFIGDAAPAIEAALGQTREAR